MCVYYMKGAPEGSPKVVLWRSRESNLQPLVYKTNWLDEFCYYTGKVQILI